MFTVYYIYIIFIVIARMTIPYILYLLSNIDNTMGEFSLTCNKPNFYTNSSHMLCSSSSFFIPTLFSENVLTVKKPRAMVQLAKMQMDNIPGWPSFTCSREMGNMRRGETPLGWGITDVGWYMRGISYCL